MVLLVKGGCTGPDRNLQNRMSVMGVFRRSSWSSMAASLLVGVAVLGSVEHQVGTATASSFEAAHLAEAECRPEQARHLDPAGSFHHDCVVCRLGSKNLISTNLAAPGTGRTTGPLVVESAEPLAAVVRPSQPARAPPAS